MSISPRSRGVLLPRFGQVLVLVIVLCAGWLVWLQFREPVSAPEPAPPTAVDIAGKLRAIEQIADLGPEAVPELREIIADPDPLIRRYTLFGLGRIGPNAAAALDQVRERLTDEVPQVRVYALHALWRITRDPDELAVIAERMLEDSSADVREAFADLLEFIGPTTAGLVSRMLESELVQTRIVCLHLLRKMGWSASQPEIDEAVRRLLDDPDPTVRPEALTALVARGTPTPAEIRELLDKKYPIVVRGPRPLPGWSDPRPVPSSDYVDVALGAIARVGPDDAELLPEVLSILGDDEQLGRESLRVLPALGAMRFAAGPAVPRLLRLFERLPNDARIRVASTLIEIGLPPDEMTRLLVPLLTAANLTTCSDAGKLLARGNPSEARRQVIRLMPQVGSDRGPVSKPALYAVEGLAVQAGDALPELIRLIENSDLQVSIVAVRTLGAMGPDAAPAVLALVTQLRRPTTRLSVAEAIGKIGPAARSAVPALLAVLDGEEPAFPSHDPMLWNGGLVSASEATAATVMTALACIGDGDVQIRNALQARLENRSYWVRLTALRTLRSLRSDSPDVLVDLMGRLRDPAPDVGAYAALAIGDFTGDRSSAVAALAKALSDDNPYVRTAAAISLGKMGDDASSAVPTLRSMLGQPGNKLPNSRKGITPGQQVHWPFRIPELDEVTAADAARSALEKIAP